MRAMRVASLTETNILECSVTSWQQSKFFAAEIQIGNESTFLAIASEVLGHCDGPQ